MLGDTGLTETYAIIKHVASLLAELLCYELFLGVGWDCAPKIAWGNT